MEERTKDIIEKYADDCRKTLEANERQLLSRIIGDKHRFDEECRLMDELKGELQQIKD